MLRPSLTTAAVALLCASAMAQGDLSSRPKPITAPFKHAGVYHVATGTWTRNSSQSVMGPDIIYNNSCNQGYYTDMANGELFQHRSRLPTTGPGAPGFAPTVDSQYYGSTNAAHRYDKRPGCDNKYVIQHFLVVYCSSINGTGGTEISWFFSFADAYTLCGEVGGDMVPDPFCDYVVSGLPVGTSAGGQICWIVDIDLSLITPACSLTADQDGTFNQPREVETFGYSQGPASAIVTPGTNTGPVLAGNFTWTGGTAVGVLTPCTGADGTIWDNPVDLTEEGTGMNSQDFFRLTGPATAATAGCYYFNSPQTGIHADFYLKLFSKTCGGPDPMNEICFPAPGQCPCGNDPVPPGQSGCNNFGTGPVQSGQLTATGNASLSGDTVTLVASGENNTSLTVFWSGTNQIAPVSHAAGRRCTSATLKRLYNHNASGGNVSAGFGVGSDLTVSQRSANVGSPCVNGVPKYFFNIYRDPSAAGPCGSTSATVNLTNGGSITYGP